MKADGIGSPPSCGRAGTFGGRPPLIPDRGTLTFDDFHGPYEGDNMAGDRNRVFAERDFVELDTAAPDLHEFLQHPVYPQVLGPASIFRGRRIRQASSGSEPES